MTDPVSPCRLDMLMRLLLARLVGRVGMNRSAIARALDLHRHTVQKYYPLTVAPERHHTTRKTSALTPYEGYLLERWRDGCQNAKQLWREVVARGDPGAYRGVALLARHLRDRERAGQLLPRALTGLTPAGATGIAMMRPEKRTAYERHVLVQVGDQHTEVQTTLALFASFAALLRERGEGEPSAQLDQGMAEAGSSGIAESRRFATKLRQDRAAVLAALTLPHSQGQTEGQVNTLKLVKRAMYGRAKFDLLRQRILYTVNGRDTAIMRCVPAIHQRYRSATEPGQQQEMVVWDGGLKGDEDQSVKIASFGWAAQVTPPLGSIAGTMLLLVPADFPQPDQ